MPGRLIESRSLEFEQTEQVSVAGSVKILVQWRAGHRRVCTRDHPPPCRLGSTSFAEMNPHDPDPEGQLVDPMSRKFSAPHLEALDHFEHVKAGHRCFFNLASSSFRSPSLSCLGSTFSKYGISQFQTNQFHISCSSPLFVTSP